MAVGGEHDQPRLRVVTWNVWWRHDDWQARQPGVRATLQALDADIVALQEASSSAPDHPAMLESLGYHVVASPRAGETTHAIVNVLASRWPIVEHDWCYLDVGEAPPHRTLLWSRADGPSGPIDAFCTHLSHGFDQSALRQRQVAQVARFVAERRQDPRSGFPPLLLGDLNGVPDSDEIRMLTGHGAVPVDGLVFTDAWAQAGDGPGATYAASSPYLADSAWPDRRLDYVMVGWPRPRPVGNPVAAWLIGEQAVDGVVPSDHYGLAVDLVAPPAEPDAE